MVDSVSKNKAVLRSFLLSVILIITVKKKKKRTDVDSVTKNLTN